MPAWPHACMAACHGRSMPAPSQSPIPSAGCFRAWPHHSPVVTRRRRHLHLHLHLLLHLLLRLRLRTHWHQPSGPHCSLPFPSDLRALLAAFETPKPSPGQPEPTASSWSIPLESTRSPTRSSTTTDHHASASTAGPTPVPAPARAPADVAAAHSSYTVMHAACPAPGISSCRLVSSPCPARGDAVPVPCPSNNNKKKCRSAGAQLLVLLRSRVSSRSVAAASQYWLVRSIS